MPPPSAYVVDGEDTLTSWWRDLLFASWLCIYFHQAIHYHRDRCKHSWISSQNHPAKYTARSSPPPNVHVIRYSLQSQRHVNTKLIMETIIVTSLNIHQTDVGHQSQHCMTASHLLRQVFFCYLTIHGHIYVPALGLLVFVF